MKLEIKKENVRFMQVVNNTVIIHVTSMDCESIKLTFHDSDYTDSVVEHYVKEFDLIPSDRPTQFIKKVKAYEKGENKNEN